MTGGIVDIVTATPGEHITNDYFDGIGLTDEWIRRRTGVRARWWMDPDEPLENVGAQVCAPLVARHGERVNIGALIVVSCSTGGKVPGIAQRVAKQSGLETNVLAFDVNAACSGFTPTKPAPSAAEVSTSARRSPKSPMPQLRAERRP